MPVGRLHRTAAVAFATSFATQGAGQTPPASCAGLPPDSLEAALLDCDAPSADAEPLPEALTAPLPDNLPEPLADATLVDPEPRGPAPDDELVQLFQDWLERHPLGEPVDLSAADLLDRSNVPADLEVLPEGQHYAELDGMIVSIDAETRELVDLVRRAPTAVEAPPLPAEAPNADRDEVRDLEQDERDENAEGAVREADERAEAERERQDNEQGDEAHALDIPNGHRPPPGSCRVWYPDRPPGHQPPPTSCDVEVPEGAVLIRG